MVPPPPMPARSPVGIVMLPSVVEAKVPRTPRGRPTTNQTTTSVLITGVSRNRRDVARNAHVSEMPMSRPIESARVAQSGNPVLRCAPDGNDVDDRVVRVVHVVHDVFRSLHDESAHSGDRRAMESSPDI